jgi:integral membrane sensor domain MASE1
VFGVFHVRWLRRHAAKGEKVPEPVFQFVFGVILAPIALAIGAALAWTLLRAL